MAEDTQPHTTPERESRADDGPDIAVCESCPGRSVFLESGNRDGWIASDLTIDVLR